MKYDDYRREFGNNQIDWCMRKKKMYIVRDLAFDTGISEQTLSKYINGKAVPNVYNAIKIAKALDVSVEDLFGINFVPWYDK